MARPASDDTGLGPTPGGLELLARGAPALGAALGAWLGATSGVAPSLVTLAAFVGALGPALLLGGRSRRTSLVPARGGSRPSLAPAGAREHAASEPPRERVLGAVADGVPDAVVLFSEAGTIRYSNAVARELFFEGQNPEGQNFIRLVGAAPAALREALLGATDRFFSVEVDARRESYHVSRRAFLADGEQLTLLVVRYLTRELGRREAEVLQHVVRVISHEVNNSLAPISSLMHSARRMAESLGHARDYQRVFDTIDERVRHLGSFLEGYAALARLPPPRRAEASLRPLLAQAATLYPRVKLPEAPALPGWFDAAQIEQLVINLIKNALEAGSAPEDVELVARTDADGATELDVLDRGAGFSAEALRSAALPLYTTKPGGSGMGLALCREIAEAHGGSLDVANREGGGGCVRVRLGGRAPATSDLTRSRLTLTRR